MELKKLKDSKKGQDCIVFGNGYSINQFDLNPLLSVDCFCANWFCLHPLYSKFKSITHAVSDRAFFTRGPDISNDFMRHISKNKDVKLLFNLEQKQEIEQTLRTLQSFNISFLQYTRSKTVWDGNFTNNVLGELFFGYTVIIDFILPLISWMGYENVYLIGADCDYRLEDDGSFASSYFFNVDEFPDGWIEHLVQQKLQKKSQSKLIEWNKGYAVVSEYFQKNNSKLWNVGDRGKLSALPRITFQEVLGNLQ